MNRVKENEKAPYCLQYVGSRCDEVTKRYDSIDGCTILQKSVGWYMPSNSVCTRPGLNYRPHPPSEMFETTVFLSPNGKQIHILHCYHTQTMYPIYHTTKLSVSDFKKINKALNKNLKIKKENK